MIGNLFLMMNEVASWKNSQDGMLNRGNNNVDLPGFQDFDTAEQMSPTLRKMLEVNFPSEAQNVKYNRDGSITYQIYQNPILSVKQDEQPTLMHNDQPTLMHNDQPTLMHDDQPILMHDNQPIFVKEQDAKVPVINSNDVAKIGVVATLSKLAYSQMTSSETALQKEIPLISTEEVGDIFSKIVNFFVDILSDLLLLLGYACMGMANVISSLINLIQPYFEQLWSIALPYIEFATEQLQQLWNSILPYFEQLWNSVLPYFEQLWNSILPTLQQLWNSVIPFFEVVSAFVIEQFHYLWNSCIVLFDIVSEYLSPLINIASEYLSILSKYLSVLIDDLAKYLLGLNLLSLEGIFVVMTMICVVTTILIGFKLFKKIIRELRKGPKSTKKINWDVKSANEDNSVSRSVKKYINSMKTINNNEDAINNQGNILTAILSQ